MCETPQSIQSQVCSVDLTHLAHGGCSVNVNTSFYLPLSHSSQDPTVYAGLEPWNQGYSQDVGDDTDAPAKQKTVKSGPPASNPDQQGTPDAVLGEEASSRHPHTPLHSTLQQLGMHSESLSSVHGVQRPKFKI